MTQQTQQSRFRKFIAVLTNNFITTSVLSLLFGIWFTIGLCNANVNLDDFRIDAMTGRNWVVLLLFTLFFYMLIQGLHYLLDSTHRRRTVQALTQKQYIFLFAAMLLVLVRYYAFLFVYNGPGSVPTDTYQQLQQYVGERVRRNDNPYLLTLLYGWLHDIGRRIGGANGGIYLNLSIQVLVMAWAYVRSAFFVYEKTGSVKLMLVTWAFYLIMPVFGGQAQIWLKDSIHSGIFTLFFIEYVRMFSDDIRPKTLIRFCVLTLLACMTRKATVYIIIVCLLLLTVRHLRSMRKSGEQKHPVYWAAVAGTLVLFILYENILLPVCGVAPAQKKENYVIPFRITTLMVRDHSNELSADDMKVIDRVMDHSKLAEAYNPDNIDAVKALGADASDRQLSDLLKLDIRLSLRYPLTALQAVIDGTWRYYYPVLSDRSWIRVYITEEDTFGWYMENQSAKSRLYNWFCVFWEKTPVLTMFTDPGLYIWLLFFAFFRALRCRHIRAVAVITPLAVFALGLLATPINGDLRYAFPVIAALPLTVAAFGNETITISGSTKEQHLFDESLM
ncbi:MAG: DUF6020 family protein [Clostridia bacterium]|nr:DUF6020 family protein [Clostridia bacterium]